jgi:molybdenum cofactor cytidylyltransferase
MKFGHLSLTEALGAILAHSIATPEGVLKKGRVLGAADLAHLAATGHSDIVAARLEAGDVGENEAARRVAAAAAGPGTRVAAPFTGRANLYADALGLAIFDPTAVAAVNALDEGLTVATLPPFARVAAGQMIATVKVITFSVPESIVAQAEAILQAGPALVSIRTFAPKAAGLVLTRMPKIKSSVLEKRRWAIARRLETLGSRLLSVETVAHSEPAVAAAILRLKDRGADPIILFAASAIVDRGDVIPAALLQVGGEIVRLGMPVDPGNLILLGRIGTIDVIGAPSCAASPKLNGFDWVLERRLAGLQVGMAEMAAMALGGLLQEIATRPQPRGLETVSDGGGGAPQQAAHSCQAKRAWKR